MKAASVKSLHAIALLLLCACACGAEPQAADGPGVRVLRGQWDYLDESTRYCMERVPSMRDAFLDVREQAAGVIERAENIIVGEARGNTAGFQPVFDMYTSAWLKLTGNLMASLKKQPPSGACEQMLANWQSADVDLVLEDWRIYIQRNGPVPHLGNSR
jgi:hypothetical protein